MNDFYNNEQRHIDDESEWKKANSVEWFDNKAGTTDWLKPKSQSYGHKRKSPNPTKPVVREELDFESMSLEELHETYARALSKLQVFRELSDEARKSRAENHKRTINFATAVMYVIKKKSGPTQSAFINEFERLRDVASKFDALNGQLRALDIKNRQLENEIKTLRQSITANKKASKFDALNGQLRALDIKNRQLENEIKTLRQSKTANKKMERMRLSNNREILIHFHFKQLVKSYFGESIYLELIGKADDLADKRLSEKDGEG